MTQLEQSPSDPVARRRLLVTGVVQGVGFRPFIYALALRSGLAGHVGNDSAGVFIEVEGPLPKLDAFQESVTAEAPPLAYIEQVRAQPLVPRGESDFTIVHSESRGAANTLLSPDVCTCADCLRETLDPANRRYRYPFTNCTNCGPRFTIIEDIPYDRPLTSMAEFPMCAPCRREYQRPAESPLSRAAQCLSRLRPANLAGRRRTGLETDGRGR